MRSGILRSLFMFFRRIFKSQTDAACLPVFTNCQYLNTSHRVKLNTDIPLTGAEIRWWAYILVQLYRYLAWYHNDGSLPFSTKDWYVLISHRVRIDRKLDTPRVINWSSWFCHKISIYHVCTVSNLVEGNGKIFKIFQILVHLIMLV